MERSFIVQGRSLQSALERAEVLLHCDQASVAYEVIPGSASNKGLKEQSVCKLRVWVAPTVSIENAVLASFRDTFPKPPHDLLSIPHEQFLNKLDSITTEVLAMAAPVTDSGHHFASSEALCTRRVRAADFFTSQPFGGHIIVEGSLKLHETYTTHGSVEVEGDMENGAIAAQGPVKIHGAVLGTVTSEAGDITVGYTHSASVSANLGHIVVNGNATSSTIYARGMVTVNGNFASGDCYGEAGVTLGSAGSRFPNSCIIAAGCNRRLLAEIEAIRVRAVELIAALGESRQTRDSLLRIESEGQWSSVGHRSDLWNETAKCAILGRELMSLSKKKKQALGMINTYRGAKICVSEKIYPKVKILIDDCPTEISAPVTYASFSKDYDAGTLRLTSFS